MTEERKRVDLPESAELLFKAILGRDPDKTNDGDANKLTRIHQELVRWHSIGEVYGTRLTQERIREALGVR